MNRNSLFALALVFLVATGCSWFRKDDYKATQAKAAQPLEVPPELTSPTMDDRYSIPDPKASTSYSTYSQKPASTGTPPAAATPAVAPATVLPKFEAVKLERYGDSLLEVVR